MRPRPLVVSAAIFVATGTVRADDAADGATLAREAETLRADGNCAAAVARWWRAEAKAHSSKNLLGIASCELEAGRPAAAARALRKALTPAPGDDPVSVEMARAELATVEPSVPKLFVLVRAPTLVGASMTIDGRDVDPSKAANGVEVEPGMHVVEVRVPDRTAASKRVEARMGERTEITLDTAPIARAATVARPPRGADHATPQPPSTRRRDGAVLLATSAVLLASTGFFAVRGTVASRDVDAHCGTTCDSIGDSARRERANAIGIGYVALGAAVFTASLGGWLLVTAPRNDGAAVSLAGSF